MSKPHLHAFTATITFREGEPREVAYDVIQCVTHGFNFIRESGEMDYIAADLIAEIATRPNPNAPKGEMVMQ